MTSNWEALWVLVYIGPSSCAPQSWVTEHLLKIKFPVIGGCSPCLVAVLDCSKIGLVNCWKIQAFQFGPWHVKDMTANDEPAIMRYLCWPSTVLSLSHEIIYAHILCKHVAPYFSWKKQITFLFTLLYIVIYCQLMWMWQ